MQENGERDRKRGEGKKRRRRNYVVESKQTRQPRCFVIVHTVYIIHANDISPRRRSDASMRAFSLQPSLSLSLSLSLSSHFFDPPSFAPTSPFRITGNVNFTRCSLNFNARARSPLLLLRWNLVEKFVVEFWKKLLNF